MRIVLDTTILVRSTEKSHGPARDLLLNLVASEHTLLLSNEMLHELARVLRYPRLLAFYGLSGGTRLSFHRVPAGSRRDRHASPLLTPPIRDVNDIVVLQTAILGEANILCTRDDDFYTPPAAGFLDKAGIAVMNNISLLNRLRS